MTSDFLHYPVKGKFLYRHIMENINIEPDVPVKCSYWLTFFEPSDESVRLMRICMSYKLP